MKVINIIYLVEIKNVVQLMHNCCWLKLFPFFRPHITMMIAMLK